MAQRGAGKLDSRQLIEALDLLGAERSSAVTSAHTVFSATVPSENFLETLAIYADVVRRPHLPEAQLADALRSALLELQGAADDLAGRVSRTIRPLFFGSPAGRDPLGTVSGIEGIQHEDVVDYLRTHYQPQHAILAVAGSFDWSALLKCVREQFADWVSVTNPIPENSSGQGGYQHLLHDSQQTQIAVAFPAVPCRDTRHFLAQGAVGILGSGVSSRLFTRVREERGLCYSIGLGYGSTRDQGAVSLHAGTTSPRAQETLDVAWRELVGLKDGISEDEVKRLKVRMASLLVFEQESSASRASGMVWDWYHLDRVVSTDELQHQIDSLTADQIVNYWINYGPQSPCAVTLGPEPLKLPWL
jgi:predicted Zn-dependent peptidase